MFMSTIFFQNVHVDILYTVKLPTRTNKIILQLNKEIKIIIQPFHQKNCKSITEEKTLNKIKLIVTET
jgi:hypothetical protein